MLLRFISFGILTLILAEPAVGQTLRGVVTPLRGLQTCQVGRHDLVDACTGQSIRVTSAVHDLDAYVCQEVIVSGFVTIDECPVLHAESITTTSLSCPLVVRSLTLRDAGQTRLQWNPQSCFPRFDVIRGNLVSLSGSADHVSLGPVVCIADDWDWWVTGSGPTDGAIPTDGGFFYLVRGDSPQIGNGPYGFSSSGLPEVPDSGDCP